MPRIAAWAATSVLFACALTACGGSSGNGVASKSPNAIVSSALSAIDTVKSVHIAGHIFDGPTKIELRLDLVSGQGGRGAMSEGGRRFQMIVVGGQVYVNGTSAYWEHHGGAAAAATLTGKWLRTPVNGQFAPLANLTDLHALISTVLAPNGGLVKIGNATIAGQPAVGVRYAADSGTVYVATSGNPYPLEILNGGGQGGRLVLSSFNEPVPLAPPAHSEALASFS